MILMFGDVHAKFTHILPLVKSKMPAAIILLGDIQAQRPLEIELAEVMKHTEVYFIHGNHDTDSQSDHDNLFESAIADRNLHGRIVEIDGHKVAGFGGIFRGKIWWPDPIQNDPVFMAYEDLKRHLNTEFVYHKISNAKVAGELRTHKSSIFYEDYIGLFDQNADILVSHEAPSCHPHGFEAIDQLAQSMKVKRLFHGHHHDRLDYMFHDDRLGFCAHGVGLRGVTDINGAMIKAGELDEKRMGRGKR